VTKTRFTVGDKIRVTVDGEMTGITEEGTLTVQYPSDLGTCETTVELHGTHTAIKVQHLDPDLGQINAKDQARHEVIRAALRLTAECWPPDGGEAEALDRLHLWEPAVEAFDAALDRYVELADA
jgi:hypothetical protein